jgi:hypothetical protein
VGKSEGAALGQQGRGDGDSSSQRGDGATLLEADVGLLELLQRNFGMYLQKQRAAIKGWEYHLGDYAVRVGGLSLNGHPEQHWAIEAEVGACDDRAAAVATAHALLSNVGLSVDSLGARTDWRELKLKLPQHEHCGRHTAAQYMQAVRDASAR